MKLKFFVVVLQIALLAGGHAQRRGEAPLIRPEEVREVQRQTVEFFDAIRPAASAAVRSTVWVWANTGRGNRPVVFGTVVGDGSRVLTKWSEIAMAQGDIQVVGGDGTTATAEILGVHEEEDLAVLKLEGARFPPVVFSPGDAPTLGRFLIATSPDDTPASVGVVAVEQRSLREKDQAFLGVILDPDHTVDGVRIVSVEEESAADEAGLSEGDVILSVGERTVGSLTEIQTALAAFGPGQAVDIRYSREGTEATAQAVLQGRNRNFPKFENRRLQIMERMGTEISLVRSGFPRVIQTDMQLDRDRCGGPVVDLDGKVVGIAIARADRTRSFVIPSQSILEVLAKDPVSPRVAQAAMDGEPLAQREEVGQRAPGTPRQRQIPRAEPFDRDAADRMRRNLEDMQALMDRMREEMEMIGE